MTTKPKTSKTPANRAAKQMNHYRHGVTETGWPIENRYDRNFSSNDIPKLIARWRFLDADRGGQSARGISRGGAGDPRLRGECKPTCSPSAISYGKLEPGAKHRPEQAEIWRPHLSATLRFPARERSFEHGLKDNRA
jgi:hypothetical protein